MQANSELSPSFPDWSSNFHQLINAFYTNTRSYPKARKAIALQLAKVYSDITDIDQEALRAEIVEDMVSMWERTLFEETNEDILQAAFDIMSREIVLATMADSESNEDKEGNGAVNWAEIAQRIRAIWRKVAITSPPYYESDKLAPLHNPPPPSVWMHSPSAASTPSAESNQHKFLHSPSPSLVINSISAALHASASSNTSSTAESMEPSSSVPIATGPSLGQPQIPASASSQPNRQSRAVFAVTFFIKAFGKLAFRSPQSLKVLLSDAPMRQYANAARMAIALFRDMIFLVGVNTPKGHSVAEDSKSLDEGDGDNCEPFGRLQCPKARLVILQWLMRLRADRNHRIYGVGEIESEVLPLARLIYRAERPKALSPQPQSERQGRDLPSGVMERRRNRAETKGATDFRVHRPMEREKEREGNSREHTREPRGRGGIDPASTSVSRSRSRPPASPQTPYTVPRPGELLWSLPQPLAVELEKHAMRPSPAMATFASIKNEDGSFWLHVDYYVQTISNILEHETDWEIVSYILCHLPLQLANKHFFCGPKTKVQIRRLVLVICNAINGDKLSTHMDLLLPGELTQVDIQGLLYHTLTVLMSYHRAFDPNVGEYDQNAKSIKADIVEVIYSGLAKDEVTNKPCLEALSLAVYELPDQVAKFTGPIVEKLSRIMSNPNMAVHILELLVIIGYTPRLYSGSFREEEYKRVFGVALLYIEHHYRPDATKLRTSDGRESYSLAQHVLNTAFLVIYIWFLAIKLEDRVRYVPFISKQLLIANKRRDVLEPSTEVCFDWLSRYAYSNADSKSAPSFLHRSIVAPGSGSFNVNVRWDEQHRIEMDNVAGIKAWKLGNSIVTISTMKKPPGWVRIVSRRPSGLTELICRLENWPHVSPGDFAPDLISMPVTMLADRPTDLDEEYEDLDVNEVRLLRATCLDAHIIIGYAKHLD
jgi:tuberous sclerosis protein 2